ncbi:MAG: hypothetical protein ACFFCW_12355 [Candidatus Hodarchaeota archaeon]
MFETPKRGQNGYKYHKNTHRVQKSLRNYIFRIRRIFSLTSSFLGKLIWTRKSSKEILSSKPVEAESKKYEYENNKTQAQAMVRSYISIR